MALPMSKRRRRIEVVVESLAAGGDGVARGEDGRVTFVPRAAPGDTLLVSLVQERKQFARGKIAKVLKPSEVRVEPRCKLFADERCGGCQWQHIEQETQHAAKQMIVEQGLRRAIGQGMECATVLEPCPPWQWRRRARFSFWAGGPKVLGFFPQGDKKITDVAECPQLAEGLQTALTAIRTHLLPGLSARGEVSVVLGSDGTVHVAVHGSATRKSIEALAADPIVGGVSHGTRSSGAKHVRLEGGVPASADSFAQASAEGNEALCQEVVKAMGDVSGLRVLELFAGSGNFTRLLGKASEVVAIESAPLFEGDDTVSAKWIRGDAATTAAALATDGERFDAVLLDPPRSGAREVVESIAALGPKRIVYVSCDVATLSRDIDALTALGYKAVRAQPIDLMPQTAQVEVVAVLELA